MTLGRLAYSVALLSLIGQSLAEDDVFGLQQKVYIPLCAHACRTTIIKSRLECSDEDTTTPQCYASDSPYLETLAFCISKHCSKQSSSTIDTFWSKYVIGWELATPQPMLTYEEALSLAGQPTSILSDGQTLENASLVAESDYVLEYASLADWTLAEQCHTKFA
jgi:hypothetical protein